MLLWLCTYVSHKCQVSNISIGQWTYQMNTVWLPRLALGSSHPDGSWHNFGPMKACASTKIVLPLKQVMKAMIGIQFEGETSFVSCANGIGFCETTKNGPFGDNVWVRYRHRPQPTLRYDFFPSSWSHGGGVVSWSRGTVVQEVWLVTFSGLHWWTMVRST